MNFDRLEYYISEARIKRFLWASDNSKVDAQKEYHRNLRVCQAFYPVLNLFEITIRNVVNYQISSHFQNPNWILHEKHGFMSDPSLEKSNFYLKNEVAGAEKKLKRKRRIVSSDKIIAEQTFGFWTSLFEPHHYKLIGGCLVHGFPNKPASVSRKDIAVKLDAIRSFRNRVYHNEPICFVDNQISYTNATLVKNDIYELLSWIGDDIEKYVHSFDNIDTKLKDIHDENLRFQ